MEAVSFSCPACGATLNTNSTVAGKKVRCPKCENVFVPPEFGASTAIEATPARALPPALAAGGWKQGDRVLAQWGDGFWYPATAQSCDTQSVRVAYDDGSSGLVEPTQIQAIDLAVGDRIFVRWQRGPEFHPGKLARLTGENIQVHYDDGDHEDTTISMVRVVRGELSWRVGDRVLAQWLPEPYFYPAKITAITDGIYISVVYEDGDNADLLPLHVRALDLQEGDIVYCRWQKGPNYYPGRIAEKNGDKIRVAYDDGADEWSTISLVRVTA